MVPSVIGGPHGDAGLTGRKIIIDTYGGASRHGGGAFSGKDPSKVDRSAAYAMRWVAKNAVAAGLADRLEVQVAYAIGKAAPVGLYVETFGTAHVADEIITTAILDVFDLRPKAIIDQLDLLRPIYAQTLKPGFPEDAEAVLIVELEDLTDGIGNDAAKVEELLMQNGAQKVERAKNDAERARIWRARKESFGAIGRISPSYYVQDGVIPRSKLPEVIEQVEAIGKKYNLTVANVFHAGDGNLHPLILYNYKDADEVERTHHAGEEILKACLSYGGALSGEHGIGLEKRKLMTDLCSENDLENMNWVRECFNPESLLNPSKAIPTPGRCGESKRPVHISDDVAASKMVARKSGVAV